MTIKVMLVDDSQVVRGLMTRALEQDSAIQIITTASDGRIAVDLAKQYAPDIIVLDVEMPNMDGITAIPLLLAAAPGARIIMASRLTRKSAAISLQALGLGASDYIAKPEGPDLDVFYRELREKIHALSRSKPDQYKDAAKPKEVVLRPAKEFMSVQAVAVASSTGGPQALIAVFSGMKGKLLHVPVFITQHMPPVFTTLLAENIASFSGFPCQEGKEGMVAKPGHIYIAPGDYHMTITREGKEAVMHLNKEARVNYCRPSADPMFNSLSVVYGKHLLGVVLTGMGRDGADGAQTIVDNGGAVIAQDEKSCVVYGMPKVVIERELCQAVLPLPEIAPYLIKHC